MKHSARDQFRKVLARAESGVANAQFSVGCFYKQGRGCEVDRSEVVCWWLKAAQQGHSEAERELRSLLRHEVRFRRDEVRIDLEDELAVPWWYTLELADAESGEAEAQTIVGRMCWHALGTSRDASAAVEWWTKAAGQGSPGAALELRRRRAEEGDSNEQFKLGTDEDLDQSERLYWLGQAEILGHLEAICELGKLRLSGPSTIRDSEEGARLLCKAARARHRPAILEIHRLFSVTEPPVPLSVVDGDEAIRWLCEAAKKGQPEAQYKFGLLFLKGTLVPDDPKQAHLWMLKAAEAGHDDAEYVLGCMYQFGHGVRLDEREALRWLELSADHGNGFAQAKQLGAPPNENLPWE